MEDPLAILSLIVWSSSRSKWSSASSSSGFHESLLLLLDEEGTVLLLSELPVCACVFWAVVMGAAGRRTAILAGSPVLPLPVEFVAGGDGRPEPTEVEGLGGSGRSGREVAEMEPLLAWPLLFVLWLPFDWLPM